MTPRSRLRRLLLALCCAASGLARMGAQGPNSPTRSDAIQPGHWVELRGTLAPNQAPGPARFEVESVELLRPQKYETLIGSIVGGDADEFVVLGIKTRTADDTDFGDLRGKSLVGARIKLEGRWRGDWFEARELSSRGPGRERIVARVEEVERVGGSVRLAVMHVDAWLAAELEVSHELPLAQLERDTPRPRRASRAEDADDDDLGAGRKLGADWSIALQLGFESTWRENHDLDEADEQDRQDQEPSARARLSWTPSRKVWGEQLSAVLEGRVSGRFRTEDDEPDEWTDSLALGETWLRWDRIGGSRFALVAGRQDFDDPREWIHDQNLDALRLIYAGERLNLELSASTSLALDESNSERDEDTHNYIAYLSNTDPARHLALWVVDRRDQSSDEDSPIWFGARALGKWLPRNKSWVDVALRRGYRDLTDLEGYGFDLGTTWSPRATGPVSFTASYAFGSGDADPLDGADQQFTQTGFQDDTAKFAGVTSFQYYGELVDPELSNLGIATIGIGTDLPERQSLDLVWHGYRQDVAAALTSFGRVRAPTNGDSADLGWELDLIYGCRAWDDLDIEIVLGWFEPGAAFDDDDPAWLARAQIRWRP
jgi:alginate production protein